MSLLTLTIAAAMSLFTTAAVAQSGPTPSTSDSDLKFVVYLTRHGVRSPTGKSAQYEQYSVGEWPMWDVPPGYLTPHGFHLMELFGAFDRKLFVSQGLFHSSGCADTAHLTIYADSDERTRESGKALGQGLFPHCKINLEGLAEGKNDPLFHPSAEDIGHSDSALAVSAIAGRIGGDPANVSAAYREQIAALDSILAKCGGPSKSGRRRTSLLDLPATLSPGQGDHAADLKGPLNTASTLAENLLLEYTEGMDSAQVGWGCVGGPEIRSIISIHTAATDITQRTRVPAQLQASNLLYHIAQTMEQAARDKPVVGSLGKTADKAVFLIGHDTNIENIAGLLNLDWIADGRRDDTPPGSVFVFELWKDRVSGASSVRLYYTAQTLEQMRTSAPLTPSDPPQRVQLFIPGCSRADASCTWESFSETVRSAIEPRDVVSGLRH